jgi:hypothetical protein
VVDGLTCYLLPCYRLDDRLNVLRKVLLLFMRERNGCFDLYWFIAIPEELSETTGILKVDLELAKPLMILVG